MVRSPRLRRLRKIGARLPERAALARIYRELHRHFGGLRRYGSPFAVLLYEHIHPNIFTARIFAVAHAFFGVASCHNSGGTKDTNIHGAHFKVVQRIAGSLEVRQDLSLGLRFAVPVKFYPAIGENVTQLSRIFGFRRRH